MTPPRPLQPRHVRYSVRHQARPDAETYTTWEELSTAFHCKRSPLVRFVMPWGLIQTQGWTIDQSIPASVSPVPVLPEPERLQRVHDAAAARGMMVAAWVRYALWQGTAGEESVDETGVGDEPPVRTMVSFWIAALVLASLLSACAAGWPPPPTVPECVFIPRCRNPALGPKGD